MKGAIKLSVWVAIGYFAGCANMNGQSIATFINVVKK
jgi:hypothetical protein